MCICFSTSPDAEVNCGNARDIIEIKQEVSDEDGTRSSADDSRVQPSVKLVPVSNRRQRALSSMKLRSRVCREIPDNPYQCNLCGAKFSHIYKLRPHVMNKHRQREKTAPAYRCAVCSSALRSVTELRQHLADHCDTSEPSALRNNIDQKKRRNHIRYLVGGKQRKVCGKMVKLVNKRMLTHSGMSNQKRSTRKSCSTVAESLTEHTSKLSRSCEVCGKTCRTKSRLTVHMQCHADSSPHERSVCHQKFKHVESARIHTLTHTETGKENFSSDVSMPTANISEVQETPGQLNAGKKSLVSTPSRKHSENGKTHRRSTVRRQSCETCGKSVVDLRKHRLTHSGKRAHPRACDVCGKLVSDMYKHKKIHQQQLEKSRTCEICGVNVADMRRHKHREIRPGLQSCDVSAKTVADLCGHEQTHLGTRSDSRLQGKVAGSTSMSSEICGGELSQSEMCELCGEYVADMNMHKQTHPEVPSNQQSCEVCGKVVADMYKHRKTHAKQSQRSKSCDVCGKVVVDLYRHRKVHSGRSSQSQSCDICGKSVVDMYKHKLVHRGVERPMRLCTVCGKSVKDLRRHRQIHEGVKRSERYQQPCDICGKVVSNVRLHRQTHEEHRLEHQCTQCGRCYANEKSLKHHARTHSAQKNFVCAECGRRYSSKTALSAHMWIHSAEPRHRCSVCGKAFRWYVTWKRHLWLHGVSVNRSHNCSVCRKYFASPYLLRDHMRSHSGEKPFMCFRCGRRFAHKSSLLSHQKCSHSAEKSTCAECGKSIRAPRMPEHMRTVHRDVRYRCPHCELEFRQRDWLDWHAMSHEGPRPFVCESCDDSKDNPLPDQFNSFPEISGICTVFAYII